MELGTRIQMALWGLVVGALLTFAIVAKPIREGAQSFTIKWVEHCWPNKPSWQDPWGTCWINGQRVIIDRD